MMLLFLMKGMTKYRARAIKEKFWGNPKGGLPEFSQS